MHASIKEALKTHPFSVEYKKSIDMISIAKEFIQSVEKNVTDIIPSLDHADSFVSQTPLKHKRLRSTIRLAFKQMKDHCVLGSHRGEMRNLPPALYNRMKNENSI